MPLSVQQVTSNSSFARRLGHISELDGLRGIAAIMVFFHHVCYTSIHSEGWSAPVLLLRNISRYGDIGIDLFFVLSGFLITSLLIADRSNPAYYRNFYWKRALRILPLYLLCLLGVLLMIPGSGRYVFFSAIFLANFAPIFHIANVGPFWTLAIEEQFYVVWPTVIRRRSVEQIGRWALAIGLVAILLRLVAAFFGHHNYYYTFFHCDGLAFGAFLACWFYPRPDAIRNQGNERPILLTAVFIGLALILAAHIFPPNCIAFYSAFAQTGITLLCGSTIAYILAHTGRRHLRTLRSPFLTFFGLISYAMYLTHLYVLRSYDALRGPIPAGDNTAYVLRFSIVFGITIFVCLITRYLIELPALSLRRFVLSDHARRPTLR